MRLSQRDFFLLLLLAIVLALFFLLLVPSASREDSSAGRVYWASYSGRLVAYANLDGSGGDDLDNTYLYNGSPEGIAIDMAAGKVYWSDRVHQAIRYANLDGSGSMGTLSTSGASSGNDLAGIVIDKTAGRLYYSNFSLSGSHISYAKLDGTGGGDLATPGVSLAEPRGLALDKAAGKIYWSDGQGGPTGGGSLGWAKLDGTGGGEIDVGSIPHGFPNGMAIDIAANKMYWLSGGKINYANLDGTSGGSLPLASSPPVTQEGALALDKEAGKIYWSSGDNNLVNRANLDGSGSETLSTAGASLMFPIYLALAKKPQASSAPKISGQGVPGLPLFCSAGSWAQDNPGTFMYRSPATTSRIWQKDGDDISGESASSFVPKTPGSYRCGEVASNIIGDGASYSGIMAVVWPQAKIIARPPSRTRSHKALFRWQGNLPGESYRCSKDGKYWRACSSPRVYKNIRHGKHRFSIRAGKSGVWGPAKTLFWRVTR